MCTHFSENWYDDTNVVYAAITILSITCNTIFDKLLENPVFKNIENISGTIAFPEPDVLIAIVSLESSDISASNHSNVIDCVSHADSLNECTKQIYDEIWVVWC